LAQKIRNEMGKIAISKIDRSPVTVADFTVQALIAYFLKKKFPNDPLVGEEDSDVLMKSGDETVLARILEYMQLYIPQVDLTQVFDLIDIGKGEPANRYWTLDPIDGTKGFIRGQQYAVGLALIVDGKIEIGVIGCPNLKEAKYDDIGGIGSLVFAVRGAGAWYSALNQVEEKHLLKVSDRIKLEEAVLLRSLEDSHTNSEKTEQLMQSAGITNPPILMDSLAKYVLLAAGRGDIFIRFVPRSNPDYAEKIWDHAASVLMVEEAGGKVTDIEGKALDFTAGRTLCRNKGILVTNQHFHEEILNLLKQI
ncbi:MAG: 3'(2'),5'-bisphosphate nucleotidase, partial [Omnitrophica bacterium RIFCSPHIGHO2_12_FULL_44_12]